MRRQIRHDLLQLALEIVFDNKQDFVVLDELQRAVCRRQGTNSQVTRLHTFVEQFLTGLTDRWLIAANGYDSDGCAIDSIDDRLWYTVACGLKLTCNSL